MIATPAKIFLINIMLFLITFGRLYATEVYFDITSSSTHRIDIALPFFNCNQDKNETLLKEIHQTFKNDLEFSGRFNVIDISQSFPGGNQEIINPDFRAWYLTGIQALVTGYIKIEENQLDVNIRLFDVPMGQQIVGIRYEIQLSKLRTVIHRFSDEIQFRLTGERGINSTPIAFTLNKSGNKEIYLVDPDGHNLMPVTKNGSINLSPAWTPNMNGLFFTSFIAGHPDLYYIDITTKKILTVSKGGMNITPVVSFNGKYLCFSKSFDGDPEIVLFNLETKKEKRLTFSVGVDTNPTFAPNDREIAFTSERSGTPQIYIMDIDGTNIRRLTYLGKYNTSPEWSPRGDWIAYHSRREGVFDIWLIHPDGTDEHPVTAEAGHNEDPTWARDGRHLAFISTRGGGKGLYIMDISGRSVKAVFVGKGSCGNPSWSK